jgi:formiminotetrahydrofolate cyclodeaminase
VSIVGTEIIGLIPREALERAAADFMRFENFRPGIVLERRIDELMPSGLEDVLDEVSDPARATGGGSAALAGAMASAVGVLVCRRIAQDTAPFEAHREFFTEVLRADASGETGTGAAEAHLGIAERAARLLSGLRQVAVSCPPRFAPDVATALGLAGAAMRGGASAASLYIASITAADVRKAMEMRLQALS